MPILSISLFSPRSKNFSINIFNPRKMSPMIHAERIFDILKSGKFLDENAEFSILVLFQFSTITYPSKNLQIHL